MISYQRFIKLNEQAYNIYLQTLGYSLGAGFFVFLFNGNFKEFIVAMVGGFIFISCCFNYRKIKIKSIFFKCFIWFNCSLIPSLFLKANYIDNVK